MSSSAVRREAADAFIGSGGPAKRPGFAERRRLARARGSSSARQKTAETLLASPEAEGTCWVMTTADGKEITHASPQWHETWHYSPDETIGKSPTILNGEGSDIDASRALMRDLEKACILRQLERGGPCEFASETLLSAVLPFLRELVGSGAQRVS